MPVPKRKVSRARRDSRQANKGIKPKSITGCSNCAAPIMPHQACLECGFYKGKKVLVTKMERSLKRGQKRQVLAQQRAARQASGSEGHEGHQHDAPHSEK